jgi:alginate O-acetyltransferase complex protein AlgI
MVFASLPFIFLILPVFLCIDSSARFVKSAVLRNSAVLFVSLLFYTWGEAANVFLLLALGAFNYAAGRCLPGSGKPRLCAALFVIVNLAVLIGFKYAYWMLSFILPALVEKRASLPLGISFFTFHAVSYIIDVHRRQIQPAKTALDFLTYFCMFPHLVAGPVVRYAQVKDALSARGPDRKLFSFGMYRFLLGLNKKIIIANSVAVVADSAFSLSGLGHLHFFDAWLGIKLANQSASGPRLLFFFVPNGRRFIGVSDADPFVQLVDNRHKTPPSLCFHYHITMKSQPSITPLYWFYYYFPNSLLGFSGKAGC